MLGHRWDRFMCPNGIRRTFNPKKWEHGTPVLVFGELAAFGSAVAAIFSAANSRWFLYAAAVIGAGALAWYALDKSSLGEMPLTGVSADRIANVVRFVNTEEKLGPVVSRDTISADGTQATVDFLKTKPEVKIHLARSLFEQMAPAEAQSALRHEWTEADADQYLRAVAPHPIPLRLSGGETGQPREQPTGEKREK